MTGTYRQKFHELTNTRFECSHECTECYATIVALCQDICELEDELARKLDQLEGELRLRLSSGEAYPDGRKRR